MDKKNLGDKWSPIPKNLVADLTLSIEELHDIQIVMKIDLLEDMIDELFETLHSDKNRLSTLAARRRWCNQRKREITHRLAKQPLEA